MTPESGRRRLPTLVGLAVLGALLATLDASGFGAIRDGREMLSAATALARFGEVGVSLDFDNAVERPGGDGHSRYGLGQSLALAPFVLAARALHAVAPAAPTAPVLALLPALLLSAAAAAVARAALSLGAGPLPAAAGGAGLVLASPLLAYGGTDFSEPLQVALVAAGLSGVASLRAGPGPSTRSAVLTGLTLGLLPLTKSLLLLVTAPLLALALPRRAAGSGRKERKAGGVPVAAVVLASCGAGILLWALLDLVRFGRLLGGYPGETFSYPPLTGLLRLTVLPNKGILVYAPVLLLAPAGLVRLFRRDRPLAYAVAAAVALLFASAAAWWAWDGQAAWGPRLVLPTLPFLFLLVALALDGAGPALRAAAALLLGCGLAVNLLGTLVPFPGVYALAGSVPFQPIDAARAKGTPYEVESRPDGSLVASGPHHLSLTPAWSPVRVHALLLGERWRGGDVAARLERDGLPGLSPPFVPANAGSPAGFVRAVASPFRWPFWGRSFREAAPADDPYRLALFDQAVRAAETRRPGRAVRLVEEALSGLQESPDPRLLSVGADAALAAGRPHDARRLLARAADPCHPWLLFVAVRLGDPVTGCLAQAERSGFEASVAEARGRAVSAWARGHERAAGVR